MTSFLEDGSWQTFSDAEKRALRDKLAETCVQVGIPINDTVAGPLQLSMQLDPKQTSRPPIQLIDDGLTWLHNTPDAKLMVFAPPRAGKSNLISRWFPFYGLTRRPTDRFIVTSYASNLAQGHAAAVRDMIIEHGAPYGLRLRPDESTRADWTLTAGGGVRARGVRSGLVGQSMSVGIIDDPYRDRAEADSPLIRERVWEWYSSAFVSRQAPGARQILTLTRWHVDDIAGRLLEREGRLEDGGEWKVIHLPAIALTPDPERGIYPDPLGREPGELLQHPLIDIADTAELTNYWTKRRNSSTARDWSALYQGTPFDATGGLLTEQMIRDRTGTPGPVRRAGVGVDPSGGGRDTAGIVGGMVDTNGKFWWTHDRTAKMSADNWAREACLLAYEIDADRIVYESNYGGDQAGTLITQAWSALQAEGLIPKTSLCPRVVGVQSRKSKYLRAEPIAQAVITDRAGFSSEQPLRTLKGEWQMWETGSTWSPGALDAGVHLAYELLPAIGAGATVHSVAGRRRDSAQPSGVAARRIAR